MKRYPEANEAGNRFQLAMLEGLESAGADCRVVMSHVPAGVWPRTRKMFVTHREWSRAGDARVVAPGFINIVPVKPLSVHMQLYRFGMREALTAPPDCILAYNCVPGHASAALHMARRLRVPYVPIVADVIPSAGIWRSPLRFLEMSLSLRVLQSSDGLIVLSDLAHRELAPHLPAIRLEGGVAPDWETIVPVGVDQKTVMYAGTPAAESGIDLLLSAFERVQDPEIQLVISGRGGREDAVRAAALRDPRIRYVGFLPRADLQKRLAAATVLLNPRPSAVRSNRYNFPSKLLEYMASGRPVITTATGGVGEEYRRLCFVLDDEDPARLASLITNVCSLPGEVLRQKGERGRQFVLGNRRWHDQARLVLDFINDIALQRGKRTA